MARTALRAGTVQVVQLRLGDTTFDLTTQALYVAPVQADGDVAAQIAAATAARADAIVVNGSDDTLMRAVGIAVGQSSVPVAARSATPPSATVRRAVVDAGAALWFERVEAATADVVHEVVAGGASVAIDYSDPDRKHRNNVATTAVATGVPAERLVLVVPATPPFELVTTAEAERLTSLVAPGDGPHGFGLQVAAMMAGARIIETNHVREARRVGTTVSELLKRRSLAL